MPSLDFITSSKRHFQQAGSLHIWFGLSLDRIETFEDKVQIPVDKLETQYLTEISQSPSQIFCYHN